jgi:hypothetical protein
MRLNRCEPAIPENSSPSMPFRLMNAGSTHALVRYSYRIKFVGNLSTDAHIGRRAAGTRVHGQTSTSASHHGAEEPTGKVHVWLAAAEYSALASQLRFRQQHTQPPEPALHWRDVRQDIKHLVHARPVLRDAGVYGEPGRQRQAVDAAVAVRHLPALRQPAFHAVWNPRTGHL